MTMQKSGDNESTTLNNQNNMDTIRIKAGGATGFSKAFIPSIYQQAIDQKILSTPCAITNALSTFVPIPDGAEKSALATFRNHS